jgi:cytochrome c peroxidase
MSWSWSCEPWLLVPLVTSTNEEVQEAMIHNPRDHLWPHGSVAGLLLLVAACSQQASAAGKDDLHGAAPVAEQQKQLSALITHDTSKPPPGIDPLIWAALVPDDNKPTAARIELGRKLYFDARLSADGTVSCSTCHDVTRSFTDRRPVSEGIREQLGQRNSPTTMNAALLQTQFWDARARTLEDQAKLPILNPVEMGMPDEKAAVAAIAGDPEYQRMFEAAYGRPVNYQDIGRAIASFERTLIFLDSPFDRFLAGDTKAISDSARRGWVLYNGKARCVTCHPVNASSPLGSDNRFHNIGVSARHQNFEGLAFKALAALEKDPSLENIEKLALGTELSELGRFLVSRNYSDIGGFRTPQIRNIGITAPYMHDGSMQTLWDVMDHYNKGGEPNLYLDGGIEPLALSEGELADVIAFLFTLTDVRFASTGQAEEKRQRQHAEKARPFRNDALAQRRDISFKASK